MDFALAMRVMRAVRGLSQIVSTCAGEGRSPQKRSSTRASPEKASMTTVSRAAS